MNRFEELMTKAERCRNAAKGVKGQMRTMWEIKAYQLEEMALNLLISELN